MEIRADCPSCRISVALCPRLPTNYREMNRFPDFQTDLLFSETPAAPADEHAKTEAPAKVDAAGGEHGAGHEATTIQPVPLAPQVTGVLEPISGMQTFLLTMFGVLAFIMLVALTRYGSKNNYGD